MSVNLKAVIFDMDGVLIDSEPLWRRAMVSGFAKHGIVLSEDDCRKTTGMRIGNVVEIWINHLRIENVSVHEVETTIVDELVDLIEQSGKAMPGVMEALAFVKNSGLKIGLATSSSHRLMSTVLKCLCIEDFFNAQVSAEYMAYGKPHPEVFIVCSEQLNVFPADCLVVEDSVNGVIAAKAAQMKAVAVPDIEHLHLKQFAIADHRLNSTNELLQLFKEVLPAKTA
jgi:mannitol-1-/sugar-/sorbitol-6-/2-deoxyglucose-6-phosphatase